MARGTDPPESRAWNTQPTAHSEANIAKWPSPNLIWSILWDSNLVNSTSQYDMCSRVPLISVRVSGIF